MPSSASIINASKDNDLRERAIAIAAEQGLSFPSSWVDQRLSALACAPVDGQGNILASVYEFAQVTRDQAVAALPPAPGVNPAGVTDDHLRYAITSLTSAPQEQGQ